MWKTTESQTFFESEITLMGMSVNIMEDIMVALFAFCLRRSGRRLVDLQDC